ncbi:hypothetical protein KA005_14765 [bacterium]|nr:hypothetical protein [bacterium]
MKNIIGAFSLFVGLQVLDLIVSIPNMEYEANPVGIAMFSKHGTMGLVLMKVGAIASVALVAIIFKSRARLALCVTNVLMSVMCLINLLVVMLI